MDHGELGQSVKDSYRHAAAKYRCDDEIEITSENYRHLKGVLTGISTSFVWPITVLDAGCGTGRYFHCLRNVEKLIGIDISEEMLEIAQRPVRQDEISAKVIALQCENIHLASFPSKSFDLIYSLGMFGHGCPITEELCNKFYDWLAPGGRLFIDAVDVATMSFLRRVRRNVRRRIQPLCPQRMKRFIAGKKGRVPFFGMSKRELEEILRASDFANFSITSHVCRSPLWQGKLLECLASKPLVKKPFVSAQ
jgi:SAM-dependent methyltransferase